MLYSRSLKLIQLVTETLCLASEWRRWARKTRTGIVTPQRDQEGHRYIDKYIASLRWSSKHKLPLNVSMKQNFYNLQSREKNIELHLCHRQDNNVTAYSYSRHYKEWSSFLGVLSCQQEMKDKLIISVIIFNEQFRSIAIYFHVVIYSFTQHIFNY